MNERQGENYPEKQTEQDGPNKPPRTPKTLIGASEDPSLSDIERIRNHPSLYIGSTRASGLHHLINGILMRLLDQAVDESFLELTINGNRSVTLSISPPSDIASEFDLSDIALEARFTKLSRDSPAKAGKFVTFTKYPIPFTVLNALSDYFYIEAEFEGTRYRKKFLKGISQGPTTARAGQNGNFVSFTFLPDLDIFAGTDDDGGASQVEIDAEALGSSFRQSAFLFRRKKIALKDYRPDSDGKVHEFYAAGGVVDFVRHLNSNRQCLHAEPIEIASDNGEIFLECALQWADVFSKSVYSYVNGEPSIDGGTHLSGFSSAVRNTLIDYGKKVGLISEQEMLLYYEDFAEGLTAIVSVRMKNPLFLGPTMECLSDPEVRQMVYEVVAVQFWLWLNENSEAAANIIQKGLSAAEFNRGTK